jgi:hypothetical protein
MRKLIQQWGRTWWLPDGPDWWRAFFENVWLGRQVSFFVGLLYHEFVFAPRLRRAVRHYVAKKRRMGDLKGRRQT